MSVSIAVALLKLNGGVCTAMLFPASDSIVPTPKSSSRTTPGTIWLYKNSSTLCRETVEKSIPSNASSTGARTVNGPPQDNISSIPEASSNDANMDNSSIRDTMSNTLSSQSAPSNCKRRRSNWNSKRLQILRLFFPFFFDNSPPRFLPPCLPPLPPLPLPLDPLPLPFEF